LAYLFMAIAMGLGLGADQTLPVVVSALAILAAVAGQSACGNAGTSGPSGRDWNRSSESPA